MANENINITDKYIAINNSRQNIMIMSTGAEKPVLLISGEEDMICPVPAAQRWLAQLTAPKKDFVIIKSASHMVNFEQPETWNDLLKGLLEESN